VAGRSTANLSGVAWNGPQGRWWCWGNGSILLGPEGTTTSDGVRVVVVFLAQAFMGITSVRALSGVWECGGFSGVGVLSVV
jgi:hypothetical protein